MPSQPTHADVLVVGLGALGSASLDQLALRGAQVIGLDRHSPPHTHGSSHGETRITRLATGEGDAYVPIVQRSHQLWRQLEQHSGETLFQQVGGLFLASGGSDFVARTRGVAQRAGLEHHSLSGTELRARFPQFCAPDDTEALLDPQAGMLFPEKCVKVQLERAQANGARLHTQETVLELRPERGGVRVRTDRAEYHAGQVVLSAGPWLPGLLGGTFAHLLRVHRQVLYWFAPHKAPEFAPERFPVFIWAHGPGAADHFYGFPQLEAGGGVKVATEQLERETAPDTVERTVSTLEAQAMFEGHLRGRLPGLNPQVLRSRTCLYTVTPDGGFVLDRHPDSERVLLVSACSGHGFKHSAALGEAVAQRLLEGVSDLDLSGFALSRLLDPA